MPEDKQEAIPMIGGVKKNNFAPGAKKNYIRRGRSVNSTKANKSIDLMSHSRRDFLKTSAMAVAATAFVPDALSRCRCPKK